MPVKIILLLLSFGFCQFGYAQAQVQAKDPSESNLVALRTDIKALQTEQQLIITRLDELKQLLLVNNRPAGSALPVPQPSKIDIHGEKFRGDNNARIAIVEYADFECPYCGDFERRVFPRLLRDYIETGKVKYLYRDLPLPGHSHAMSAARAARCAGEQGKYWEMHDSLFAKQDSLSDLALLERAGTLDLDTTQFAECQSGEKYTADIQNNILEAQKLGVDGTPTFFVGVIEPSGEITIQTRFKGSAPFDIFKSELDTLLSSKTHEAVSTQ